MRTSAEQGGVLAGFWFDEARLHGFTFLNEQGLRSHACRGRTDIGTSILRLLHCWCRLPTFPNTREQQTPTHDQNTKWLTK